MNDTEKLACIQALADDLDTETGEHGNFAMVVASDIRDILAGHPDAVAWNRKPKAGVSGGGLVSEVNAGVVVAALDAVLDVAEDRSMHPQVRASIVRQRLKRLRAQVAERVEGSGGSE